LPIYHLVLQTYQIDNATRKGCSSEYTCRIIDAIYYQNVTGRPTHLDHELEV
jgi:hypothetical protein